MDARSFRRVGSFVGLWALVLPMMVSVQLLAAGAPAAGAPAAGAPAAGAPAAGAPAAGAPAAGALGREAASPTGGQKGSLVWVREELDRLQKGLAQLDSLLDQVKELRVDLVRLGQVVDRLERAAEAPAALDRQLRELSGEVSELARRMEEMRGEISRRRAVPMVPRGHGGPRGGGRVGYDEGFYVSSRGGRYLLQANGLLRTVFHVGQAEGPGALKPEEPLHLMGFEIPNALLMLRGNIFSRKLQYFIEAEIGAQGFALHDFAFHLRTCPFFAVTVGQFPVRFTQQQYDTPYGLLFPGAAVAAQLYGLGRDIGVKIHFYQWGDRVFQELAVFNGGGANALANDNVDLLYMARAGVLPLGEVPDEEGDFRRGPRPPRLRLAGSYLFMPMPTGRDLDGKEGMDNTFVHQAAAEVSLWWAGLFVNAEIYLRHEDRGAAVTQLSPAEKRRQNRYAAFGQASYTIRTIGLSVAGRYSYTQPVSFWRRNDEALVYGWRSPVGLGASATLGAQGMPESVHEVGGGLIYSLFRSHLKLYLGYTFLYEEGYRVEDRATAPSRRVHLVSLMAQARF